MKTVYSMTEARKQFEALCVRVSLGETLTITRYGKPACQLEPLPSEKKQLLATDEKLEP